VEEAALKHLRLQITVFLAALAAVLAEMLEQEVLEHLIKDMGVALGRVLHQLMAVLVEVEQVLLEQLAQVLLVQMAVMAFLLLLLVPQ
jgi:hypothetical protein